MTPQEFWTALGAGAAVLTVGAMLILHIIRYAYKQGVTDQRIAALEKAVAEMAGVRELLAGIQSTVEALTRAVDRLDRATERLNERPLRGPRPPAQTPAEV